MRMPKAWTRLGVILLGLLSLACGPCSLFSSEVPTPPGRLVVSTESAGQLESRIQQNMSGAPGQPFILRLTDVEATSLVYVELARYDESPVADPHIWFADGKIQFTGRLVNVLPFETEFAVVASARIEDHRVVVDIEQALAGALPLPTPLLTKAAEVINETMDELQLGVEITDLEILEGEAIIQGVRK